MCATLTKTVFVTFSIVPPARKVAPTSTPTTTQVIVSMDALFGEIAGSIFREVDQAVSAVAAIGEVKKVILGIVSYSPFPRIYSVTNSYDVLQGNSLDSVHVSLAPCYGTLNNEAMQKMDDNTKVMIGTT